jgi:hypothetical protein
VSQAPADLLHSIGEAGAFLAVVVPVARPAFDCLGDMLDPHRQVEPVKHMESWTNARRLSQRPRPVAAIAKDGQLRARCCAKAMQHAAQLLGLPIGLGWHTADDDLLVIIIAGLRNEHLEGPYLKAAHRAHVTGVDGQRDRLRICRR